MGFSAEKLTGTKAFVPPDITFKDGVVEMHEIAGLRVEVLPSKTDVTDSVAFYFPARKLLVSNALAAGVIFTLILNDRRVPIRDYRGGNDSGLSNGRFGHLAALER
jgi:hypothetical protein